MQCTGTGANPLCPPRYPSPPSPDAPMMELDAVRRRLEAAEMALTTVQRAHTEAVERSTILQSESQRSLVRLHDEVAYKEGLKWQERLQHAEQVRADASQSCFSRGLGAAWRR